MCAAARHDRKVFFSEEKQQKTVVTLSPTLPAAPAKYQKFFGSFFQKRTTFYSWLTPN
jgi:hypothetical protein